MGNLHIHGVEDSMHKLLVVSSLHDGIFEEERRR